MKLVLLLLCSVALAQDTKDEPVVMTPEQIREHIKKQQDDKMADQLIIMELSGVIEKQNKVIDALRSSTNCT